MNVKKPTRKTKSKLYTVNKVIKKKTYSDNSIIKEFFRPYEKLINSVMHRKGKEENGEEK